MTNTNTRSAAAASRKAAARRGMTFIELMAALTVLGVLIVSVTPSFTRTIEQAHADVAGASLEAIWSAQRVYWLEHHEYADKLRDLDELDLLDPVIMRGNSRYRFEIRDADEETFIAEAERFGSRRREGVFSIDESGEITGAVRTDGEPDIFPGFH